MKLSLLILCLISQQTTKPHAPPRASQLPTPGSSGFVSAPLGSWVPAMIDAKTYGEFLSAVRLASKEQLTALYPDRMRLIPCGAMYRVIRHDPIAARDRPKALRALAGVDALVVNFPQIAPDQEFYTPSLYCQLPDDGPHPSLEKFPVLTILARHTKAKPSEDRVAFAGSSAVPVATNLLALIEMVKEIKARDKEGIAILQRNGQILMLESRTEIKILERTENPFIAHGTPFVEARVTSGTYRLSRVFLPEQATATTEISINSLRDAKVQRVSPLPPFTERVRQ